MTIPYRGDFFKRTSLFEAVVFVFLPAHIQANHNLNISSTAGPGSNPEEKFAGSSPFQERRQSHMWNVNSFGSNEDAMMEANEIKAVESGMPFLNPYPCREVNSLISLMEIISKRQIKLILLGLVTSRPKRFFFNSFQILIPLAR